MRFDTSPLAHVPSSNGVPGLMRRVMLALVPGTLVLGWWFGIGVFSNLLLTCGFALACEAAALRLRRLPVRFFLEDGSALVCAWLLALALPPLSPWWLCAVATALAIVVAKHLYGGLGHNPFNPAMVGYVAVLVAFPVEMTAWLLPAPDNPAAPGLLQSLSAVADGSGAIAFDSATGATALDFAKTELGRGKMLSEISAGPVFGMLGGRGWEWAVAAWFAGGLWLLWKQVIRWQIPTATLGSLLLVSALFWVVDPEHYASPLFHLFGGATVLGAFFIATDPVSASTTPRGRLIYGAGIGALIWVIRSWGGYPDGVAFAVLLMNIAAPTIDRFARPRVYGHARR